MATSHVCAAWAALAGLDKLATRTVLVTTEPGLCPRGWAGVLRVEGTITAVVPYRWMVTPLTRSLERLGEDEPLSPAIFEGLGTVQAMLGPAALYYPPDGWSGPYQEVEWGTLADIAPLLEAVPPIEREESGLDRVTSPVALTRGAAGLVLAAGGFVKWPHGLANICVLARPGHRGQGLAQKVGSAAVTRAMDEGLVAEWRARYGNTRSRAVARSLGLLHLGDQLRAMLAGRAQHKSATRAQPRCGSGRSPS